LSDDRQAALHGSWVHSHEEDSGQEMVFRRETFPFPLARGRDEMELDEDGRYTALAPGPVDVPQASTGTWTVTGERLVLTPDAPGQAPRVWTVRELEDDRLVVSPVTG